MANRTRPPLVMVLSVFNILVGVLALLCGGGCGAMMAWFFSMINKLPVRPGEPSPKDMFDIFARNFPYYEEIAIGSCVLAGILGLFLIICGIGSVMMKQWGRILTILVALAIALHCIGLLGYYFAVVIPNQPKMQKELLDYMQRMEEEQRKKQANRPPGAPPPPPAPAFAGTNPGNQSANHAFNLIWLFGGLAYSGAMIIVMVLPGTRAAFAQWASETDETDSESRQSRRQRLLDDDEFDRSPMRDRYDDDPRR